MSNLQLYSIELSFHAGLFPSALKAAQLSRAHISASDVLEFKHTKPKADPAEELSSQPLRSTTESTFLKHKTLLSSPAKYLSLLFLSSVFLQHFSDLGANVIVQ